MWQYTFIIDQAKCAQKHQYEFQPWKVKGASDQELFSFEGQSEAKGLRSEAGGAATWINLLDLIGTAMTSGSVNGAVFVWKTSDVTCSLQRVIWEI